ncbi:MAG: hypothetical protein ACRD4Q_14535 [Candidatus Acidiferrales bacterium]
MTLRNGAITDDQVVRIVATDRTLGSAKFEFPRRAVDRIYGEQESFLRFAAYPQHRPHHLPS